MKPISRLPLGATMLTMTLAVTALAATPINYHLANTYKFGAAPGDREYFDYITFDPDSRRLYLSHGSEVLVVNADTGKEEGKISGLKQSHGVAVSPKRDAASSATAPRARRSSSISRR